MDLLIIYKALRLPVLVFALGVITFILYKKKNRKEFEVAKIRMMEEE